MTLRCKICGYEWFPKGSRIPSKCPNCRSQMYGTNNYEEVACFIATAVYGTENAPQVRILRNFRDESLLTNKFGVIFVKLYYHVSPSIADWLKTHKTLSGYVRKILDELVILVSNNRVASRMRLLV